MDEQPTILPAGESVQGIFAHIGGAIVGLSALAYFVGWHEVDTYYSALGAPWVADSLPTTRLLLESAAPITLIGLLALMAFMILVERMWLLKRASQVMTGILLLAGVLTITALFLSRWVTPWAVFWLSQSAVLLFFGATALTFAEIVVSVRTEGLKWFNRRLPYVVGLLSIGLLTAPDLAETARARRNGNPALSRLPEVFSESKTDSGWLLVTPLADGKFLLMKPDVTREKRKFRVVNDLAGWTIGPSR